MASSTRKLTNEQFSAGTTIDGDRLEKALSEAQATYNNIPIDSFSALTSKQINWALTAPMGIPFGENTMGANTGYMYGWWLGGPLEACYDGLRNNNNYLDQGSTPIQNPITYKGLGNNQFTNPLDIGELNLQYKFRWENTYLSKKPCIIKEISFLGMWDDGYQHDSIDVDPLTNTLKYYPNNWSDAQNISGYEVIISVDNNLGLANTINRDNEIRVWATPTNNFMIAPWGNTTNPSFGLTNAKWTDPDYCGYGDIRPYPYNPILYVDSVPAGIHISLKNLEIPVHKDGRIKVCLVLPRFTDRKWEQSNTIDELDQTPSFFTNMWSASMTILEELDSE